MRITKAPMSLAFAGPSVDAAQRHHPWNQETRATADDKCREEMLRACPL
jgi:hypothetical protein